jgi:hypothetical protein
MSINSLTSYNPLSINGLDTVNINGNPFDPTTLVPYVLATSTVDLNSQNIKTTYAPTASSDLTNKTYVDTQDALRASLTGNNTFSGTNTFNNNVVMGDGYTTNVNNAFASLQVSTATATGFATGGTDYPATAPVSTLVKPSYYQLSSTGGSFGMSMLFDRGYTGASFTAGASTTITGTWQANTVSSRIATITFDVSLYIGKSLRCVWEGVNCPTVLTSPYPNFIVVNGASTVFTSPAPLVGTNTFVWNFTPTVATTTITITLQASGTPSLPALAWTGFSIKQVGAFAYQSGATYKLTLTNIRASSTVYYDIYQYNTSGSMKIYIGSAVSTPITTTGQNISLFFYPNLVPGYTGTIVYEFQAGSANQYVRFDSALMTRADMQIYGTLQNTSLSVAGSFVSNNPSGNSGNGSIVNMTAFNGAYGSIEAYDTANSSKLPLALNAFGGNVGIGTTAPIATFQMFGTANVCGGVNFANVNNYMATGSLTIGSSDKNYGGGAGWNSNTAGLLLECQDNTEIAVHDAGTRVASFMYYTSANNTFNLGRDMGSGWGVSKVEIRGDLILNAGTNGRFIKQGSDANYYAAFNGGNSSNSPYIEFYAGGTRRMYFGNSTTADNYIMCENGSNLNLGTNGTIRIKIENAGNIVFPDGQVRITNLNSQGQLRLSYSTTVGCGYIFHQNNTELYILLTNNNDPLGSFNSLRPFYIEGASGRVNMNNGLYLRGGDYGFESVAQMSSIYGQPVMFDGNYLRRSQCVINQIYNSQSVAWGGGVNITYAFYNYNSYVSVVLTGKYSGYWTSGTTNQIAVRIYNQNSGNYYTFYFNTFTNNTYNHVSVPLTCNVGNTGSGWNDVYVFNNSGYSTDGNDQLLINVMTFPASGY